MQGASERARRVAREREREGTSRRKEEERERRQEEARKAMQCASSVQQPPPPLHVRGEQCEQRHSLASDEWSEKGSLQNSLLVTLLQRSCVCMSCVKQ